MVDYVLNKNSNLQKIIELECDGKIINLPEIQNLGVYLII